MGSGKVWALLECTELCICLDGTPPEPPLPMCDFRYPDDIQKISAAGSD